MIISPKIRQYFIIISLNLTGVGTGMAMSWSSPMLVKLMYEDTQLPRKITEVEGSWLASSGFLASMMVTPWLFWVSDALGRKKMMIYASIIRIIVNGVYIFANEVWMLFVVRAITGVLEICLVATITAYSAEIASKEIRGALGTIAQVANASGMLIMLSIGPYASYLLVNIVYEVAILIFVIPLFFIPDSPYSLARKGLTKEALSTLNYLRGPSVRVQEEFNEITAEFSVKRRNRLTLFKDRIFLKALCIGCLLIIGYQCSGYMAVTFYLQSILEITGSSLSSQITSVIFGVMQLIACFVTALLIDKAGRKPIFTTTLTCLSVGMVAMGCFFYVKESGGEIEGFLNYLPVISLVIVVLSFNAGIGTLAIIVAVELLDNPNRTVGISFGMTVSVLFAFLNLKYFPILTTILGASVVFWMFAVINIVCMLLILYFVPETKQKSFLEIQRALGKSDV